MNPAGTVKQRDPSAQLDRPVVLKQPGTPRPPGIACNGNNGADEGIRPLDPNLGKPFPPPLRSYGCGNPGAVESISLTRLSETDWAQIEPPLQRGRCGARRVMIAG